jgi:hypothetical protein
MLFVLCTFEIQQSYYSNKDVFFFIQIIDYTQYYIDLESSPNGDPDDWRIEYNLTHYYGLHEITPRSLHAIAETFQDDESVQFDRYIIIFGS